MKNLNNIDLDWSQIDTVLLDMDGTLLDLHFDNYFWSEHLPKYYSQINNVSIQEGQLLVQNISEQTRGTLDWYCLDFWSSRLSLDIVALKKEVDHKVAFRPNTLPFLEFLREQNKRVILATNAHPKALELKLLRADFSDFFEQLSSSHDFGYPKECPEYWPMLCNQFSIDPTNTLFIDDSLTVLKAAELFGIGHLLAIAKPDSKISAQDCSPFTRLDDFKQLF